LLSSIPLDEIVMLRVVYEFNAEHGRLAVQSPMSRSMTLRQAVRHAISYFGTGAKVSIIARGIMYSDASEFRAIWSRRSFFQQSQ
jgi:hypothetical protein